MPHAGSADAPVRPLRLLLVDADEPYARFLENLLRGPRAPHVELMRAPSLQHADAMLAGAGIDLILLDDLLLDGSGRQWLAAREPGDDDSPAFVILGRFDDESSADAALVAEAHDCLLKSVDDPSDLVRVIRHALVRRQFRDQLRETDRLFRHLLENVRDVIAILDLDGAVVYVNPAAGELLGTRRERLIGSRLWDWVHVDDVLPMRALFSALRDAPGAARECEFRVLDIGGDWRTFDAVGRLLTDGAAPQVLINARDVSARRRAESTLLQREQELRQAQKMEAIGRLAGGVAHDFSNVLTVIVGATERLLDHLPDGHLRSEAESIRHAAERAVDLTLQLLTFSRRQVLSPTSLRVADVLGGIGRFLRPLIGEDIVLETRVAPDVGTIRADRTQLEQVLLNLAINARDAMPKGGRLSITVAVTTLAEPQMVGGILLSPGPYVLMRVEDTGVGMDEGTQTHAFEPFFTTKAPDKGTGLGLATVYGIVSQSGGAVALGSRVGAGTIVSLYFPHTADAEVTAQDFAARPVAAGGSETVLLVEDENEVRELVRDILESAGYTVLEAGLPHIAEGICRDYRGRIHLLLTDMVMPEASGREVARNVRSMRPDTKVLFMSGYPEYPATGGSPQMDGSDYLPKPFDRQGLLGRIRDVLGDSQVSSADV